MVVLINYANAPYKKAQAYCTDTAYKIGKVDKVIEYGPEDIDKSFYQKNETILSMRRGGGLWLWKPYFICKTLQDLNDGDYLIYIDSGCYFINTSQYFIDALGQANQDILCFDLLDMQEKKYTKPDAFELMGLTENRYKETNQRMATVIVCKKTKFTEIFFSEFLKYAQDIQLIYDGEPKKYQEEFPDYICHREDQSIYSLLTKKYGLKGYRDPTQWGIKRGIINNVKSQFNIGQDSISDYPTVVIVHRATEVNWKVKLKVFIMQNFPRICDSIIKIKTQRGRLI